MAIISSTNIGRTELGLLVVFETLMQERSVTRAAERLGLSQPATSASLRRLRELAGDPLLLRTGHGMRPTARALELLGPVSEALASLRNSFRRTEAFNPATATRSVTLMMSDIGEIIYPARLIARIRQEAPGVRVVVRRLAHALLAEELERGTVDLALGYLADLPDGIICERLFDAEFVCAVRRFHPRVRGVLTLEQYLAESHLVVARAAGNDHPAARPLDGAVAARLATLGLQRRVALSMPHFLPAPMVVGATDLLLTLPRQLAEVFRDHAGIELLALPFDVPVFPVSAFWHRRFEADPASRWLRGIVVALFGRPPDAPRRPARRRR
jgi:DNA-binding transcriptional LysR family regulator